MASNISDKWVSRQTICVSIWPLGHIIFDSFFLAQKRMKPIQVLSPTIRKLEVSALLP